MLRILFSSYSFYSTKSISINGFIEVYCILYTFEFDFSSLEILKVLITILHHKKLTRKCI